MAVRGSNHVAQTWAFRHAEWWSVQGLLTFCKHAHLTAVCFHFQLNRFWGIYCMLQWSFQIKRGSAKGSFPQIHPVLATFGTSITIVLSSIIVQSWKGRNASNQNHQSCKDCLFSIFVGSSLGNENGGTVLRSTYVKSYPLPQWLATCTWTFFMKTLSQHVLEVPFMVRLTLA